MTASCCSSLLNTQTLQSKLLLVHVAILVIMFCDHCFLNTVCHNYAAPDGPEGGSVSCGPVLRTIALAHHLANGEPIYLLFDMNACSTRLASCSNHCLRRAIDHPALSSSPSTLTFPYSLPPSETLTQIAGLLDCRRPQTFLLLNEEQEFREVVQPTSRLRREFITALIPSSQLASSCLRPPRLAEHFIPRALTDQRVFLHPISRPRRTQPLSFLQAEHCSRVQA